MTHCPLHGVELLEGDAEIIYGLWRPSEDYQRALKYLFPYSKLRIPGGNMYDPDMPTTKKIKYCRVCRKVQQDWKEGIDWSF